MDIKTKINEYADITEAALEKYLSSNDEDYSVLFDAMRYSTLAAGKRIRPFLTYSFCEMLGGDIKKAVPFACAVEMIHNYSLIHDDMPCMDNDEIRRGKPTNHVMFGEAKALLAGDTLLTYAFEVCASNSEVSGNAVVNAVKTLAYYAGAFGMAGGQMMDLIGSETEISYEYMSKMHTKKTGALITASSLLGCYAAAENPRAEDLCAAKEYSKHIGFAFQIKDDLLDAEAEENSEYGKKAGSDAKNNKSTILKFMTVQEAKDLLGSETELAIKSISSYSGKEILCNFARYLCDRKK